uniref:Uncharacterized protein n=1 Tax=Anguilla anguilla TaxID=7936 RepID=A0A0E9PHX4_ANGAN
MRYLTSYFISKTILLSCFDNNHLFTTEFCNYLLSSMSYKI